MADYSDLIPGTPIPSSGNILQKAVSNLTSPATTPMNPPMNPSDMMNPLMNAARYGMSAAGVPEENAYPAVGSVAGELGGTQMMHPEAGMGMGAGIGSLSKEMTKERRGEQPNFVNPLIDASLTYGGGKVFSGAKNAINTLVPGATTALAAKVTQGVSDALSKASEVFGGKLNELEAANPRAVNFTQVLSKPGMSPEVSDMLSKVPSMQFFGGPERMTNLSLPESQQMINELTSQFREAAFTKGVRPEEIPGFNLLSDLKGAQDAAHPSMADEVRPAYEQVQNAYDKMSGRFDVGEKAVPLAKGIAKNDAYKTLLGPRLAKNVIDVNKDNALLKAAMKGAGGTGVIGLGEWFGNKLKGNQSNQSSAD